MSIKTAIFAVTTIQGFFLGVLFPLIPLYIPFIIGGLTAYIMIKRNNAKINKQLQILDDAHQLSFKEALERIEL